MATRTRSDQTLRNCMWIQLCSASVLIPTEMGNIYTAQMPKQTCKVSDSECFALGNEKH